MPWLIFWFIFYALLIFVSVTYNFYVLIQLFAGGGEGDRPFRLGLSTILGLVVSLLILHDLTSYSLVTILIYGALSGLLRGLYGILRGADRQSSHFQPEMKPGNFHLPASFSIRLWLMTTIRLVSFTILGATVFYGLFLLANSVFIHALSF